MLAAGNIRAQAGYLETVTVFGLPFTPRRILFRSAALSGASPGTISHGLWSADKPDSGDFPQQSAIGVFVSAGIGPTLAEEDIIAHIIVVGAPDTQLVAVLNQSADNSFTLEWTVNTLTADAYIQWVASP